MEPAATGRAEKTFSYVVRAPGGDGVDVMNVDVKIDTTWVFQDAEDSGEEPGWRPEGAALGSPDVDTGTLRRQLESSEQKLLAAVDKYVRSESGLRSRIQELELSERKLLRKVDQLSARVCQERSASRRAQEQLEALQGELACQVLEQERAARRQRWRLQRLREQLRHKDEALGQRTAALERCRRTQRRELGLVREQERALRAQVQRLQRDVRRLCRAAGLLLAELDAPALGSTPPRGPAGDPNPEEAEEVRALQARAERGERERDEAARRLREQHATQRQLWGQLEDLRCCIYGLKLSEIGLQSQVEDLAEQNRRLRAELGAQAPGERVLGAPPAGHGSLKAELFCPHPRPSDRQVPGLGAAGFSNPLSPTGTYVPDDSLSHSFQVPTLLLPAAPEPPVPLVSVVSAQSPKASRADQQTRSKSSLEGTGLPAGSPGVGSLVCTLTVGAGGPPAEGPCAWGGVEAGRGPLELVPGLETLLGELVAPDRGRPAPAEPALYGQTLLLLCGCPSGQSADASLLPEELAWISAQRPAAAPAQESLLLVQTSVLPPWGPAGGPAALLLQAVFPEDPQIQQGLDTGPLPTPRAMDHPPTRSHGAPLCWEAPQIPHHRFPETGPSHLSGPWEEGGGAPEWRAEVSGARRTRGRKEEDLGESQEDPSLEDDAGALGGLQDALGASGPQAAASCPRPRRDLPVPLLQGEANMSTEGPLSLGRRQRTEGHVWGLLGGFPSEEEEEEEASAAASFQAPGAKGPSPPGPQLLLLAEDGAPRSPQGHEDSSGWAAPALLLLEEPPGDGGPGLEEKPLSLEGSGVGSQESGEEDTLFLVGEGSLLLSPTWAFLPEGPQPTRPPRPPHEGQDGPALTIDAFAEEMEACFQQLSVLRRGSGGWGRGVSPLRGEDGSFAGRGRGGREHAEVLETCLAKEADPKESREDVRPGETEALGTGQVLPGVGPDLGDLRPGPGGPSELGQSPRPPPRALERARRRFRQLVSGLKEERSRVLHDNLRLQRDQERCHRKIRALRTQSERQASKVSGLERDNGVLRGDISRLRRELDQYLQLIADLEDCNARSYRKISELEEEKESLRRGLGRLQTAVSEGARHCRGLMQGTAQENRELKALISELGLGYRELVKDVVLGIEDMIGALRGENVHLLRRIRVLEREVALGVSSDAGHPGGAEQRPQGESQEAVDKVRAVDKVGPVDKVGTVERAVQTSPPSEPLTARVHGPPWEEDPGLPGERMGPSSGTESPRCGAGAATPSPAGRRADVSGALRGDLHGMGVKEAQLGREEEGPRRSAGPGTALRPLGSGHQPHDAEANAESPEEDLRLRVRRLRHQVLTLQCQLRDQASARDQALRRRDQLQGQVDELQKKQHEAILAVTPLKAKLASLVQKCRDRNHLLTRLLQELCRHGPADRLLCQTVRSMVDDVALAEYAATFLAAGVPELFFQTSRHPALEPEKPEAVTAPNSLLNTEVDSALSRPWRPEPWPVTEAEWPAPTARLDAWEPPWPPGPTPDPGPRPAVATEASGLPAQRLQERGGVSRAAPQAAGPPPSELRSPARILAFHRELSRSVRGCPRVAESPLELEL
ncbi:LOW QUALITY PROTEIN: uncharacterized protein C4orf50 homolog [Myotis yumanensis]|uniref:LOW QUALITY PROTEIN: uncharacterized protein C4orf50 homolog n=1 Tax=Myotis yumanensis TaxID=159337 RepID=UPI0038D1C165